MSADNLRLWNALERTDPAYTKPFDNGQFKGTAVAPIWNIKRITEQLGPVGQAWGWRVISERVDTLGDVLNHVCVLRAWFRLPDGSMGEVDGIGTTKYAYPRRQGGMMIDSEAPKKSLTDALSKIMSALGASADIWMGLFDDPEYVRERKAEAAGADPDTGELAPPPDGAPLTIVDPAGKQPARRLAFDQAASILERWAAKPETTGASIDALIACNRSELARIPGLIETLEAHSADKADEPAAA